MTLYAFKDSADGYYQVDITDGETLPEWTTKLASCPIADSTPTPAQIKQAERTKALVDLEALDRASVRDMREYIAAKVDAPILLKERELAAIALREKLK